MAVVKNKISTMVSKVGAGLGLNTRAKKVADVTKAKQLNASSLMRTDVFPGMPSWAIENARKQVGLQYKNLPPKAGRVAKSNPTKTKATKIASEAK